MLDDAPQGQQDVNTAATSSTAAPSDVNQTSQAPSQQATSPDVNKASDTSTDKGVKTEGSRSLKDVINDGLAKMLGKDPAAVPPVDAKDPNKQDVPEGDKKDAEGEKTSEEEKNAPTEINSHPAFKKVVAERTEARKQIKELQSQIEPLKVDAQRYQTIQSFLKTNNVDQKDAAEALKVTALASTDPHAFYQKIVSLAKEWGEHLGYVLPADLQGEVDQGIISPERAAELAKARGQVQVANARVEKVQESTQAQQAQQETEYRVQLFTNWAEQVSRTDPDLQKKMPMITERMKYILDTEGDPGSPERAWERLNRAHKEVSERLRAFVPPKPAIQPSPRSQGNPVGVTTAPSNYQEAMQVALQRLTQK